MKGVFGLLRVTPVKCQAECVRGVVQSPDCTQEASFVIGFFVFFTGQYVCVFTCADFSSSGVDVCEFLTRKPVEPAQQYSVPSGDSSWIAVDSKAWPNNDSSEPALPQGLNRNGCLEFNHLHLLCTFFPRRRGLWKTAIGGRMWRPCQGWREGRRCLMRLKVQLSEARR